MWYSSNIKMKQITTTLTKLFSNNSTFPHKNFSSHYFVGACGCPTMLQYTVKGMVLIYSLLPPQWVLIFPLGSIWWPRSFDQCVGVEAHTINISVFNYTLSKTAAYLFKMRWCKTFYIQNNPRLKYTLLSRVAHAYNIIVSSVASTVFFPGCQKCI